MTQLELDTAVAFATGENIAAVRQLGFSLADPLEVDFDPEPRRPLVFDWDTGDVGVWPSC